MVPRLLGTIEGSRLIPDSLAVVPLTDWKYIGQKYDCSTIATWTSNMKAHETDTVRLRKMRSGTVALIQC